MNTGKWFQGTRLSFNILVHSSVTSYFIFQSSSWTNTRKEKVRLLTRPCQCLQQCAVASFPPPSALTFLMLWEHVCHAEPMRGWAGCSQLCHHCPWASEGLRIYPSSSIKYQLGG